MSDLAYMPEYDAKIDAKALINRALQFLKPREERVIRRRFGMNCPAADLTLIAEELNCSRSRVAQIVDKAQARMRRAVNMISARRLKHPGGDYQSIRFAAGFGRMAQPAPDHRLGVWKRFDKLAPVIVEMNEAGASTSEIISRLKKDLRAAKWLGPNRMNLGYIPGGEHIEAIISLENENPLWREFRRKALLGEQPN